MFLLDAIPSLFYNYHSKVKHSINAVQSKETYGSFSMVFASNFCRYYLAYAPRILRSGVDEKVMVTTYNVNFDVEVKATLRDARDSTNVIASGVAKVQPGMFQTCCLTSAFWVSHVLLWEY